MGKQDEEPRGLYFKYRVFREPQDVSEHPVSVDSPMYENSEGLLRSMEELDTFIFPLKPDSDHHARVALAAYAFSVSVDDPQLAEDLLDILTDLTGKTVHMEFAVPVGSEKPMAERISSGFSVSELFGGATPKTD